MSNYFQEIITLLLNPPGNLVYHLVLAFSVAGALAISLNFWRETNAPEGKRTVIGVGLLMLLRLSLFVAAALAWQGIINGSILLPPLDRAVSMMSLVLIVWMWVFPHPSRMGDAASILLVLIVATLFALSLIWWSGQITTSNYNGSLPDLAYSMLSLGITTAGGLLLAIRRPTGWGYGLGMLAILLIGDVAYLTYPYPDGDFSGAARLAQIIAYPLLLLLPLRFTKMSPVEKLEFQPAAGQADNKTDAEIRGEHFQQLLNLIIETDPGEVNQALVKLIAQDWLADLCLMVSPPGLHGKMEVTSGFDLIREQPLGNSIINSQSIPVIASALRRGRALRLPASSTSPDLVGLGKMLDIKTVGHLLAAPISDTDGNLIAGIILLTPYTKRSWTADDQLQLTAFTGPLAHVLHHSEKDAALLSDLDKARAENQAIQSEAENVRKENEILLARLGIEPESDSSIHVASLTALIAAHEEAQETIAELQAENARLQQTALEPNQEYQDIAGEERQGEILKIPDTQAEGELRLALEEVAYLKSLIYEADKKLLELRTELAVSSPSGKQMQEINTIIQELRQPMSSIIGYTDFLLGETIGILGTLQRRFLERIRTSSDRLRNLIDELVQASSIVDSQPIYAAEDVPLSDVIDEAISGTSSRMRQKNIALRMDLPKQLPLLRNSRASLQRLIVALLENASDVSSNDSEITMRVRLHGEEDAKDFVLIQIVDQGGGVVPEDIPGLFTTGQSSAGAVVLGVGEKNNGMTLLKTLAESLGGRIWVDSEAGHGSTFSLLFPISPVSNPNKNGGGGAE